jgi:hypothetical protein
MKRVVSILVAGAFLVGCNAGEKVEFSASAPGQNAIVRDGRAALVSRKKESIVLLSAGPRQMQSGQRPVFVLAATNIGMQPVDLRISSISAIQTMPSGSQVAMPVITYEQLMQEEKTRQVVAALFTGVAAGANAYSASRAGYGTSSGTVYTPHGVATFNTNYYSPTANAIAQANASAQNEAMIANTIATGQRNMAALEHNVLKDNTIMPGEWIGGLVFFSPPISEGGQAKSYTISVTIGNEIHSIDVRQAQAGV